MYVTKPLSHLKNFPESLSLLPEGLNSGYLVIQDEEAETYTCCGCKSVDLMDLPFPQNKELTVHYDNDDDDVVFIPVLNKPLSSNRYYAIKPHGKHKGEAFTCSKEDDMTTSCCGPSIRDLKPRPLNPDDIYQQFYIALEETPCNGCGSFCAKSVASDGFPPTFLRKQGLNFYTKTPRDYELREAPGLNTALRARFPEFNIPLSSQSSEAIIVGKWCCPFMFIKEGMALRDQMKSSMFYEMTLQQKWEQIFACENDYDQGNVVSMDVAVQKEAVFVAEREAVWDERKVVDGAIWFTSFGSAGEETSVGLSLEIVQRMKREEERVGWAPGEERQVRVKRVEEFGETGGWRKFDCYVLVERFVLKRMDGSLVMTYDFKHTHQIKSKWA